MEYKNIVEGISDIVEKIKYGKFEELSLLDSLVIPLVLVLLTYFFAWLYWKIKEVLLIYSFRFKFSQFTSFPAPIYYVFHLFYSFRISKLRRTFFYIIRELGTNINHILKILKERFISEEKIKKEIEKGEKSELDSKLKMLGIKSIKEKRKIPILRHLSVEDFKKVVIKFEYRDDYKQNEIIMQEDEKSNYFYLLISGKVSVSGGRLKKEIILKKWDVFGEIALLSGGPRTATVKVMSKKIKVAFLNQDRFNELLKESPLTTANLNRKLVDRLNELVS